MAGGTYPQSLAEYKRRVKSIDYARFFTEEQNFYLANPKIIEAIFLGLVDLKGNPRRSRAKIRVEVLGCPDRDQQLSHCIISRYFHEKRNLKIPNRFDFPVNFTGIKRKHQIGRHDRLALSWLQETFEAPVINVDHFLELIGAARESPYYKVKDQIKQIVFNAKFENHFEVQMDDRLIQDLLWQYKQIPQDFRDRIYYKVDGVDLSVDGNLASANLRLKAEKVRINNRVVNATREPIR